jgi:hypothetical protein
LSVENQPLRRYQRSRGQAIFNNSGGGGGGEGGYCVVVNGTGLTTRMRLRAPSRAAPAAAAAG